MLARRPPEGLSIMKTYTDILARPEDASLSGRWSPVAGVRQPVAADYESPLLRLLAHRLERRGARRLFGQQLAPLSARISVTPIPAT